MNNLMLNNNFLKVLTKKFNFIRKIDVLLSVDFPILFSFNSDGKYFLGYVLEFKRFNPKLEIYFVETTIDKLILLLGSKITLDEILQSENPSCINLEKELDVSNKDIQNKLPKNNFYLTPLIPNSIDIEKTKNLLVASEERYIKFIYNSIEKRKLDTVQNSLDSKYIKSSNELIDLDLESMEIQSVTSLESIKNKEHLEEIDKNIFEKVEKKLMFKNL